MTHLHRIFMHYMFIFLAMSVAMPAASALADSVYSVNNNGTVSIIDTIDDSVTTPITLPAGSNPTALCLNPITPFAYTLNAGNNSISVIDTTKKTVVNTIYNSSKFTGLTALACDPTGTTVLIGNNDSDGITSRILYLNTGSNSLDSMETVVGSNPGSIVFNSSGTEAYVLNQGVPSLSVINTATKQVTSTTALLESDYPLALAIHTQDQFLYVANLNSNSVSVFMPTPTGLIYIMALQLATDGGFHFPSALSVSHNSNWLYVTDYMDTIYHINPFTQLGDPPVSSPAPIALIERNDGQRLYVASIADDAIRSYNTASLASDPAVIPLPAGSSPQMLTTLLGTRHNLALDITGDGTGTVNWPFDAQFPQATGVIVGVPDGIGVTIHAVADTCSKVDWTNGCDAVSGNGTLAARCTVNPFTLDTTINAVFSKNLHTVTASVSGGSGSLICSATEVCHGAGTTCTATPATGYHITDVQADGSSVGAVASYTFENVTGSHDISATFAIDTFTITASAGSNGVISPTGATTVNYGSVQSYTITPATGYHIADVVVDGSSVGAVSNYTLSNITANHTIVASFAIDTFGIAATSGINGGISPAGTTIVNYGASQSYSIAPNTGYHIADVLVDGVSVGAIASHTFSNVQAAHTISASFAIDTFVIATTAGSGGGITPTATVSYGSSQSIAITPDTGYHITDVLVDNVSIGAANNYTFNNVQAPHTVSASFAINTYTLTASAGSNGSISPAGTTALNHGSNQNYTITPNAGYHVADVLVDGVSAGAVAGYSFNGVTASHTISVSFAINTYTIIASGSANGSLTPAGTTTVSYGASLSYDITPDTGFHIVDVLVDGSSAGAVASYTFNNVTAPHTISASFAIDTFSVTPSATPGGAITPAVAQEVPYNGSTSFSITPSAGFSIIDVQVDGISQGNPGSYTFTNVKEPHTISVSFADITAPNVTITTKPAATTNQTNADFSFTSTDGSATFECSLDYSTFADCASPASYSTLADQSHTFRVRAKDAAGNITASPAGFTWTVDTIPPTDGTVTATPGNGQATLSWAPFTDSSSGVSSYLMVKGDTGTTSAYCSGGTTVASPEIIDNLINDHSYDFRVCAVDATGNVSAGTVVSAIPKLTFITVSPISNNFGIQTFGSSSAIASFTFTNNGATPRNITGVEMVNTQTGNFSLLSSSSCTSGPIAYGVSCTVDVVFSPLSAAQGISSGLLIATSDETGSPNISVTLSGTASYTVTASPGSNGNISPTGTTVVNDGSSQTYAITPDLGYHIVDVQADGVSVGNVSSYIFNNTNNKALATRSISASFAIDTFTIVATAGSNGSISPAGASSANYGSSPSYAITPTTGYHIVNVLVDGTSVGAVSSYTFNSVAASHTIAASFAIDSFGITASAGSNGSISPAGTTTVNYGTARSYTITPNTGYHIADLLVDGVSVGAVASYSFSNVTAAHTISANFAINTFAITTTAGSGGSITPSSTVAYGSSQSIAITPTTGYHISDVLVDGSSIGAVTSHTFNNITANHTISVSFGIDTFAITATAGSNGSISPAGTTTVDYGSGLTYAITPATGYRIVSVLVDGISQGAAASYTFNAVNSGHGITATFTPDTFAITAAAGTGGTVACPASAVLGSSATCHITPNIGYHLSSLTDNGTNVLASVINKNEYALNGVTAPHTISASFVPYSLADALRALRIAVGMAPPVAGDYLWLDIAPLEALKPKGDGIIGVMDALVLLKHSINSYTEW